MARAVLRLLADAGGRDAWEAGVSWREAGTGDAAPTAAEQVLWRALGGGPRLWIAEAPREAAGGFWSRLVLVAEAPRSQFDALRELGAAAPAAAPEGDPLAEPVACFAATGRGFHGHRGRAWATLPGNLHLCAALRPRLPAASCGLPLTVLPVVAAAEAIERATAGGLPVGVKWVNDLLADGRKLAGLLATTQTTAGSLDLAVLGLGVNVARAPALPASPFVPGTACLHEFPAGRGVSLPALLRTTLAALGQRLRSLASEGPGPLLAAYRARSLVLGRHVVVYPEGLDEAAPAAWPAPLAEGIVTGIGDDLALRLAGRPEPIDRGRLVLTGGPPPPDRKSA